MGNEKKKDKKDKNKNSQVNKNAKLQLKGRIFMTNVTDVLSSGKQGWRSLSPCALFLLTTAQVHTLFKYSGKETQESKILLYDFLMKSR
jgi:hypothetical protein